jgi:hypothetical protein
MGRPAATTDRDTDRVRGHSGRANAAARTVILASEVVGYRSTARC